MNEFLKRLADGVYGYLERVGFWKSLLLIVVAIFAYFVARHFFPP
jgi:hypothetical protein